MSEIPTVRIASPVSDENPLGYIVINEEDFREGIDVLFVEPGSALAEKPGKGGK